MTEAVPPEKIKRAAHLLLFRRGRRPGARDYELRNRLGPNYPGVIERLNEVLKDLDLEVRGISDPGVFGEEESGKRYVAVLKGTMTPADARLSGWKIDTLAGLAAAIALVLSKQGKVPREDVEDLLADKLGRWRTEALVDTFERSGYLQEDVDGFLALGWRAYAEVDFKELVTRLLAAKPVQPAGTGEPAEERPE